MAAKILFNHLPSLPARVHRANTRALGRIAERMLATAQANAPVRTGALRDSLRVLEAGQNHVTFGSDLDYALYQELGTRRIRPKLFLTRAFMQERGAAVDIVEAETLRAVG